MDTQRLSEGLAPAEYYSKELIIKAPREKVYQALTTNRGIAGWWTVRVQGEQEEGGTLRLEFEGTRHIIEMYVEELCDPELVVWECLTHNFFSEWPSTKVRFMLKAEPKDFCKLSFEHIGLKKNCECYGDCSLGWDHFLISLASFCESGIGSPWKL